MTCPACERAQQNPLTGIYRADCDECKARALAGGREMFDSIKAGARTDEYREALTRVFGEGGEEAGHQRVRAWAKKMKEARGG